MARFLKLVAALGLCAISALPAVAGSFVLCIGSNQHLSIEDLFASCCGRVTGSPFPGRSQSSGSGPATLRSAPSCGPCVDIPLISTAADKVAVTPLVHTFSQPPSVVPSSQISAAVLFAPQSAAEPADTPNGTSRFSALNAVLRC